MMCSDQIASDHEQYAAARASAIDLSVFRSSHPVEFVRI